MEKFNANLKYDSDLIQSKNILLRLNQRDRDAIATLVWEGHRNDESSRAVWVKRNQAAMDLALQVQKAKSFPWPNASAVTFPLVTISALQFHSEAYPALIQGPEIVRYRTMSGQNHMLSEQADRVGQHMSWQCLEQDVDWEEQHDRLLLSLPIVGTCFMKSYFNPRKGFPVDELVIAQDLVVNYGCKSLEEAERVSHMIALSRNRIWERCADGLFLDIRGEPWFQGNAVPAADQMERDNRQGQQPTVSDRTTQFGLIEQHCQFDLDGDGYEEPYIATVLRDRKVAVRLVARVDEESSVKRRSGKLQRIVPKRFFTKFSFLPSADNGFYDKGFGTLLGPINEAVSTAINQLIDNATLQNSSGGFLGRGVKIRGGVYTFKPWEWKRVDSTGDDLKKGIYPFPEKREPTAMFQLLSLLLEYSNRISGTTDPMVGENPGQNTPASTFQGMQEQGRKIYRQIFKRLWRSMRREFQLRYEINGKTLPLNSNYGTRGKAILQEDYRQNSELIAPVADPNSPSSAMRFQQATMVKQDAMVTQGYNLEVVTRKWLKALQVEDADQLYPGPGKVPPLPNPKMQMEQAKLQGVQMKLKFDQWKVIHELQAQQGVNLATVVKMRAEAAKIVADIGADRARLAVEAFEAVVQHLQHQNEQMTERIGQMQQSLGGGEDGEGKGDNKPGGGDEGASGEQGGVPGMAGGAGDQGFPQDAGGMEGGSEGAMGLGAFAGGGSSGNPPQEQPGAGPGADAGGPSSTES